MAATTCSAPAPPTISCAERGEAGAAEQVEVVEHERRALPGASASASARRSGKSSSSAPDGARGRRRDVAAPERRQDIGPQPRGVAVPGAEREPRRAARRRPAAEQHGLAPAGGRADERERASRGRVERRAEARALDRGRRAAAGQTSGRQTAGSSRLRSPGRRRAAMARAVRRPGAHAPAVGVRTPPAATSATGGAQFRAAGAPRSARARATGYDRAARAGRLVGDRAVEHRLGRRTSASMPSNDDSVASLTRPRTRIS